MLTAGFTNHSVPEFFFTFLYLLVLVTGVLKSNFVKKKFDVNLPCMRIFKIDPQSRSQRLED